MLLIKTRMIKTGNDVSLCVVPLDFIDSRGMQKNASDCVWIIDSTPVRSESLDCDD